MSGGRSVSRSPRENKVVVYHDDQADADRVVKRLSEMGYESIRPRTGAELQSALNEPCKALVASSIACDREMPGLGDWLAASPWRPAAVILTKAASDRCVATERLKRLHIQICMLANADVESNRFAQCLESIASPAVRHESHVVEGKDPQLPADVSRKLAIVQSMLQDIVGNDTLNSTMIISRIATSNESQRRDEPDSCDDIVRLPSLVLQGQSLAALAACHDAESRLSKRQVSGAKNANVTELRRCLEQELLATEIELITPETRLHPIASRSVLIGRPSPTRDVDISINCRWFSRGERSLHLWSDGSDWFIEDLGSTNGCFIGGLRLEKNKRFALSIGRTTIEIGRSIEMRAPVILSINHASPGVVI